MRVANTVLAIVLLATPLVGIVKPAALRAVAVPTSATVQTGQATNPARNGTLSTSELSVPNADPFPSKYRPYPSRPTLIRNAVILTAAGPVIPNGSVLLREGRIAAVGTSVEVPADAIVIDGTGKYVTPGIIDVHQHIGANPVPALAGTDEINEMTNPVTPNLWIEHSVWPQDPQFPRVLAGGVTTVQVLPGSANLIGGRTVVLKVVPSRTVRGMKFPGAKYGLKMAFGENPSRIYASRGPATRMAGVAILRATWLRAASYRRQWDSWNESHKGDPPARDLGLETLAEVLRGNMLVHCHCYRADDMATMLDIAREFSYQIRAFHHAVEAYKIVDLLHGSNTSAAVWSDSTDGLKMEMNDAVPGNLALLVAGDVRAMIHSDDGSLGQRLNQEVAKAMYAGRALGLEIGLDQAVRWMTINPAWALGLDDRIGSIEVGKNADVVLWSGNPFSVYTNAERVWIDGAQLFNRNEPAERWRTDFELGFVRGEGY